MHRRIDPVLTARARDLRSDPTPAEFAIWRRLSRYRPAFTRQLVEPPFIIDLACRRARLAVELDGSQHADMVGRDEARSIFLRAKGWTVVRLWNSEVLGDPDGAARSILQKAAECLGGTHPQPPPSREGGTRRLRYS